MFYENTKIRNVSIMTFDSTHHAAHMRRAIYSTCSSRIDYSLYFILLIARLVCTTSYLYSHCCFVLFHYLFVVCSSLFHCCSIDLFFAKSKHTLESPTTATHNNILHYNHKQD